MKTRKQKLTPRMVDVLAKLYTGDWELGDGHALSTRSWLQKGGLGRGGETQTVNSSTLSGLWNRGFIELAKRGFPSSTYRITEAGRRAYVAHVDTREGI